MKKSVFIITVLIFIYGSIFAQNPDDIEIFGNWDGQLASGEVDEDITLTVTNDTIVCDWDKDSLGDVIFIITQYDNSMKRAVLKIVEHPDVPIQVGMYIKITWTIVSTSEITISYYNTHMTEPEALNDTFIAFGTYAYTRNPTSVNSSHPFSVKAFELSQNYPNPFNPDTDIRYQIPDCRYPSHTTLTIYNILGQEVRVLVDEIQEPGLYTVTWDGRDRLGHEVPSGIYFYRIQANEFTATKRMVLMK